jgi:hypothetical protein
METSNGKPLFAFLRERVCALLGMGATIDLDDTGQHAPKLATSYVRVTPGAHGLLSCRPGIGLPCNQSSLSVGKSAIVVLSNDSSSGAFAQIADRLAYLVVAPMDIDAKARAIFRSIRTGGMERTKETEDFNDWFDAARAGIRLTFEVSGRASKLRSAQPGHG